MSPSMEFLRGRGGSGVPLSPLRQRGVRKRWARRSARTALVASVLLGGAVLAHGGWRFLHNDGAFGVRTIHVVGLTRHEPQALREALGDLRGRNLFALEARELSARFAAFPWLKGFMCRKHLPDTLIVEVVERQELCTVATPKGPYALDGADTAWPAPAGAPCAFRLEAGLDPANPVVQGAVAECLASGLQGAVTALAPSNVPGTVTLQCEGGWSLLVAPGDIAGQWSRFQASRAWVAVYAPKVKTLDLRWGGKVVLFPPEPAQDAQPATTAPLAAGGDANG